jgi:hypothetical protein
MTFQTLDDLVKVSLALIVSIEAEIKAERDRLAVHGETERSDIELTQLLKGLVEVRYHLSKGHLDLVRLPVKGCGHALPP